MEDMSPEAAAQMGRELPRLAKAVRGSTGAQGVNIVQVVKEGGGGLGRVAVEGRKRGDKKRRMRSPMICEY